MEQAHLRSECLRATPCSHCDLLPASIQAGLWPVQAFLQGLRATSCSKADLAPLLRDSNRRRTAADLLQDSNTRRRTNDAAHAFNLRQWPCKNLPQGRLYYPFFWLSLKIQLLEQHRTTRRATRKLNQIWLKVKSTWLNSSLLLHPNSGNSNCTT